MLFRSLALLLVGAAAAATPPAALGLDVASVELRGIEAFSPEEVLEIIRVRTGQPLPHPAQDLARTLETRYRDDGYPAARVLGSFDEESGRLLLTADEGRLAQVDFDGLSAAAAETARRAAALRLGRVLTDSDILDAFDRMETASSGALHGGDSRIEPTKDGPRLVLRPETSRFSFSPVFGGDDLHPVYPWTRVDGLSIPFGVDMTLFDLKQYDHLSVYAAGFYATSAGKLRYAAGASRAFGEDQRLTLGYEHHDLTDSDDTYRSFDLEGQRGTPVYFELFSQYFSRKGDEAYAFLHIVRGAEIGLAYRSDLYADLPVTTGSSDPNLLIAEGSMHSLIASFRFDSKGDLFGDKDGERRSFLERSLYGTREAAGVFRAEASFETTSKSAFGGDFDFSRFIANLRSRLGQGKRASLDARVLFGLSRGTLPPQKEFVLGGVGSLRGYPDRTFAGDKMELGTLEGRFKTSGALPLVLGFCDSGATSGQGSSGGVKSSLGAGLQWPPSGPLFLRADAARPVADPRFRSWRGIVRLQIPF